jgi:hypothetical protein
LVRIEIAYVLVADQYFFVDLPVSKRQYCRARYGDAIASAVIRLDHKYTYQCSGFVNGKICGNGYCVRRDLLEDRLLVNIKTELLADEAIERFTSKIRRRMMKQPLDPLVKRRKGPRGGSRPT